MLAELLRLLNLQRLDFTNIIIVIRNKSFCFDLSNVTVFEFCSCIVVTNLLMMLVVIIFTGGGGGGRVRGGGGFTGGGVGRVPVLVAAGTVAVAISQLSPAVGVVKSFTLEPEITVIIIIAIIIIIIIIMAIIIIIINTAIIKSLKLEPEQLMQLAQFTQLNCQHRIIHAALCRLFLCSHMVERTDTISIL